MPIVTIGPDEKRCVNCRYFIQHYGKSPFNGFWPVAYGHCTEKRIKARRPGDGCESFSKFRE